MYHVVPVLRSPKLPSSEDLQPGRFERLLSASTWRGGEELINVAKKVKTPSLVRGAQPDLAGRVSGGHRDGGSNPTHTPTAYLWQEDHALRFEHPYGWVMVEPMGRPNRLTREVSQLG